MKTQIFGDLIVQLDDDWDGCMAELEDTLKDVACYTWLKEHKTWLHDMFPECAQYDVDMLLEILYADGTDDMFDTAMAGSRDSYAADEGYSEKDNPEMFYECLAVPNFKEYVGNKKVCFGKVYTLAEAFRDSIYLYLEKRLENEILNEFHKTVH